ncbi:MAG: hypothetical protein OQJ97_02950 [Rhodospirillales bacterium]|nr:hypothetical protein [Rhodospirillales bacterium]
MPNLVEENMEKVQGIIEIFLKKFPPNEKKNIIIFGSSALALRNIDIGRSIDDLDVFVSDETFGRLKGENNLKFSEKCGGDGEKVPVLKIENCNAEVLKTFPGINFEDVKGSKPTKESSDIPVAGLKEVAQWKLCQGRKKDYEDIIAIANELIKDFP